MDGSEGGEDDFEVVPVQEDDGMQWDVENEDEDEIKKAKIQSKSLPDFDLGNYRSSADVDLTLLSSYREGSFDCRGCHYGDGTGQPKVDGGSNDR
jgi:hypothetical protein